MGDITWKDALSETLSKQHLVETIFADANRDVPGEVLTVTSNNRLARYLRYAVNERFSAEAKAKIAVQPAGETPLEPSWNTPRIVSLNAWLNLLWQEWQHAGNDLDVVMLNSAQDRHVWKILIDKYKADLSLAPTAARDAAAAFRMMNESRVEFDKLQDVIDRAEEAVDGHKSSAYLFADLIEQRLVFTTESGCGIMTQAEWLRRLAEDPQVFAQLQLPKTIIFAGFDSFLHTNRLKPRTGEGAVHHDARRLLRDELAKQVTVLDYVTPNPTCDAKFSARSYPSYKHELAAAATGASQVLKDWEKDPSKPKPRIGIIVQNLPGTVTTVLRELTGVLFPLAFAPENVGKDMARSRAKVFNLSYAQPLSTHTAIAAALEMLRLCVASNETPASFATLSMVLRTPWFCDTEEGMDARRVLELKSRKSGRAGYTAKYITDCEHFAAQSAVLRMIRSLTQRNPQTKTSVLSDAIFGKKKRASEWGGLFRTILETTGWLDCTAMLRGDNERIAQAKKAHDSMSKQLEILTQYDLFGDGAKMTAVTALSLLEQQLDGASAPLPGGDHAPVQVMGLLEAVGQEFTHLWVCGLDDTVWPQPARYNPFLPVSLQRYYNMPGSSPEWGLNFAERYTGLLAMQATAQCTLSIARLSETGEERRPCALMGEVNAVAEDNRATLFEEMYDAARESVKLSADQTNGFEDGTVLPGGTGLIKSMFECPFHGYTIAHLGASPVDEPEVGMNHFTWGNIVHRTMELFWERTKNSENLHRLDADGELEECVCACVSTTFKELGALAPYKNGHLLNSSYQLDALTDNLDEIFASTTFDLMQITARLVMHWLKTVEMKRPDFKVSHIEGADLTDEADTDETDNIRYLGKRNDEKGLGISCRIDRIDEVANDETPTSVIIDYKTSSSLGQSALSVSMGVIAEPQLPIYVTTSDQNTNASISHPPVKLAVFGKINFKKPEFVGQTKEQLKLVGIQDESKRAGKNWETLTQEWTQALNSICAQLKKGVATVTPQNASACTNCKMEALCRLFDTNEAYGEDGEES